MKYLFVTWVLTLIMLTGCSNDGSASKEKEEKTVINSQLNALGKTRNIGNVLQQSADQRQEELDAY
ncbi:MAG: hypothetical protein A6F70_09745 [Cycloclasticus sp. symbiont of Bathymodiolus heckerae]|nr:MAG: hypothetical protein A6F70_09745 [Cycloclasticus sp. symbiont of Bathymodiolus heckerae]